MTTQPEQILENNLISQLIDLGYEEVEVRDEKDLLSNLKAQLEKHNKLKLSDKEFKQILNYISKGNVFKRTKILHDRVPFTSDSGENKTIELLNTIHWCKNEYQVTHQVSMEGSFKNRYDVTILINGLPLVQIELKRRGIELKEAFNQTNRYQRHSYGAGQGLFQFIQIFVISNGVNTKYYSNNPLRAINFKQTFYWTDFSNNLITQLTDFTDVFLEPCHLSKMISKYIVTNESQKILMVLRPYQYYAVEAIVERVKNTTDNGYIWHTTGSGKTLTSFKTAQILTNSPQVHKVVFVVDRRDLDYQTTKEFNSFSSGSIDGTSDTKTLVKQLSGDEKLIITTIQKLNSAISRSKHLKKIEHLKQERIVFIFDECHRSQFGKTHESIKDFFQKSQMFGFTGTPIFEANAGINEYGKRTTAMLFDKKLHQYIITDAIRDGNVLKFSVEYINTFKKKDDIVDINIEAIDDEEVMNAPQRLNNIVDYIIAHHNHKTHNRIFNSIFAVSSVDNAIEYYKLFRKKKFLGEHDLNVATIFTFQANEEDKDALGDFVDDEFLQAAESGETGYSHKHTRDYLDEFIGDYNLAFNTNFTTKDSKSFYKYYNDISKRVKRQEVDILIVVNMFLTGFDSKYLNTLYVDKRLNFHGLIQAYSRTNRILNELKSQGNIVSFRNLKKQTDEAIALFSDVNPIEEIIIEPYDNYVEEFNTRYIDLLKIAPTVNSVNKLPSEEEQLEFVKTFRDLIRLLNVMKTYSDFDFGDLSLPEQIFEDYKSKYLDLYDEVTFYKSTPKTSILDDIDFEVELIHRDEINVSYILKLLAKLKDTDVKKREEQKKEIMKLISGEVELRSKKELIEKFIEQHMAIIDDSDDIPEAFEEFWEEEKKNAFATIGKEEDLDISKLEEVIGDYLFTNKEPLRDDIISLFNVRPGLKERREASERVINKIYDFVNTFISGISGM